ncbi:MAG: molybdopterin-dependent oxidoreductase [Sulfolobales archaeon]
MHVVKSVCTRDCYDTCFTQVVVDDGVVRAVHPDPDNPMTDGFLCPRGVADGVRLYRNRVLYPYVNVGGKPSSNFRRVGWDDALDIVAERLKHVLEVYGPEKVLHIEYAGNMDLMTWYLPLRFWNAIKAVRTDYSICSKSGHEGIGLHYGLSYGVLPEDIVDMRLVVLWGFNAAVSAPHLWRQVLRARQNGCTVVVVDPRMSETARQSDMWIQPIPGTDVWLGYGIARVLIEEGLIDKEFIEKYTYGYDIFSEEVMRYDLREVSQVTGVSKELIVRFARTYGTVKPNVIMIGLGVQKSVNGAEIARIASLLPALIGQHRGFYYSNSRGFYVDVSYLTGEAGVSTGVRTVSQVELGRHILNGEFKFIYIYNMNPLLTLPGQEYLRKGLLKNDVFVVIHTTHWNESCMYSDVVLPAPTYLEKDSIVIPYTHNYVRLSRKAVEPLGESMDELWVVRQLAMRLGLEDPMMSEDVWSALRKALEHAIEGSFEELLSGKTLRLRYRPRYEYQTPTGRIEFYSTTACKKGLNPLPKPTTTSNTYEFTLINTASPLYTHTQFWEVYGQPKPVIHINPEDADELSITEGQPVEVCSEEGCLHFLAKIDKSLPRKTLWVQRQIKDLNNRPLNSIIPMKTQPIGGGPTFNSTKVNIRKIG